MRRREIISLIGGAAVAWPLAARAQQQVVPVIGYVTWGRSPPGVENAFRQGLADAGYVEGRNVAIIYRSAFGQYNRVRQLAADLVNRQVSVILAAGNLGIALEAKALTATIPIVVAAVAGDPVKFGLAASLNHPGGNVTGITLISTQLVGKRLDLLHEIVPQATTVAFLSGAQAARRFEDEEADVVAAANALKLQIIALEARSETDIEAAFAEFCPAWGGGTHRR